MIAKCECNISADFLCSCESNEQGYCLSHAKSHFSHQTIKFLPNPQTLKHIPKLILAIQDKIKAVLGYKEEVKAFIADCIKNIQDIEKECFENLSEILSNLDGAIRILKASGLHQPESFLGLHKYIFFEPDSNIDTLVSFSTATENFKKYCGSLIKIEDCSKALLSEYCDSFTDQDFIRAEKKRQEYLLELKKLKSENNENSEIERINQICKQHVCKYVADGLYKSALIGPELEASIIYSKLVSRSKVLSIVDAVYTDEQFARIFEFLCEFKKVSPSIIIKNSITTESQIEMLSMALERYISVKQLDLSQNCLGIAGISYLCPSLKNYYKLLELNLADNFITSKGAEHLSESLCHLRSLISLNIASNQFGIEGALILRPGLANLNALEELIISTNDLFSEGIMAIMESVHKLPHMCKLNISMNDIGDEGGIITSAYLGYMKALSYLCIDMVLSADVKGMICAAVPTTCKVICKNLESRVVIKRYNPNF